MVFIMYNYVEEMKDIIVENFDDWKDDMDWDTEDRDDLEQTMYDDLWVEDAVTGNGSGSFFFNSEKAREAVRGNEEDLADAVEEFGGDPESYKKALTDPEWADVTLRCYFLGQAISEALDELGY
jgi:hypothetical protein